MNERNDVRESNSEYNKKKKKMKLKEKTEKEKLGWKRARNSFVCLFVFGQNWTEKTETKASHVV